MRCQGFFHVHAYGHIPPGYSELSKMFYLGICKHTNIGSWFLGIDVVAVCEDSTIEKG